MIDVHITHRLKDINLDISFVSSKKRIVLFGPSGAGKTSVLKIIAGFMRPKRGFIKMDNNIYFDSEHSRNLPINRRKVGYLPQDYVIFPNMNVKKNIYYGRRFLDIKQDTRDTKVLLNKLEIAELLDNYPETLSGGQKQRVALARALLAEPVVLLLDEPFSALHTSIRDNLRELVINITEEFNLSAILVTHDLDEAYIFGEDIIILENGKIVETGTKERIFKKPQFVDTVKLLNIKNIWKIKEIEKDTVITEVGLKFKVDEPMMATYIAVRAENIMLMRSDKPVAAKYGDNNFSAIITGIRFYEHFVKLECLEESASTFFYINIPTYVNEKLNIFKGKKVNVAIDRKNLILCS